MLLVDVKVNTNCSGRLNRKRSILGGFQSIPEQVPELDLTLQLSHI